VIWFTTAGLDRAGKTTVLYFLKHGEYTASPGSTLGKLQFTIDSTCVEKLECSYSRSIAASNQNTRFVFYQVY